MKTYCFNYAIEGVRTPLPLFICSHGSNQFMAWRRAKRYLKKENSGENVWVWFKNYPDRAGKKFQSTAVPSDFK